MQFWAFLLCRPSPFQNQRRSSGLLYLSTRNTWKAIADGMKSSYFMRNLPCLQPDFELDAVPEAGWQRHHPPFEAVAGVEEAGSELALLTSTSERQQFTLYVTWHVRFGIQVSDPRLGGVPAVGPRPGVPQRPGTKGRPQRIERENDEY